METSITLKPSEINEHLLKVLKQVFNGKDNFEITINVKETKNPEILFEESRDEYFTKLNTSVNNIENNQGLVSFTLEEFEKFSKSLNLNEGH